MKKEISRERLKEMWCELNSWKTPREVRKDIGKDLTREETVGAIKLIGVLVPLKECLEKWQEQDAGEE